VNCDDHVGLVKRDNNPYETAAEQSAVERLTVIVIFD